MQHQTALPENPARFTDNGDNTVTDTQTGLVWSKNTLAVNVRHTDTDKILAEFGDGWRLPTVDELLSIVDRTKYSPAIDTDAFPDTCSDWYWTSTPCAWDGAARWVVFFDYGSVYDLHQNDGACVRAVRAI